METMNSTKRQNSTRSQYDNLYATLQMEESAVAAWLEDTRNGLIDIFGANPGEVWENLAFLYYLWVLIDTVQQMRERRMLPQISDDVYGQASSEWDDKEARSMVKREILHALNTFRHNLFANFEALLQGSPVENGGAEAYCRGAFTKLLRMVRLSQ
jgi:hypothetical protein